MISDVTLSALANWLGSLTMILIVIYHALSVNIKRNQENARRVAGSAQSIR